MKQESTKGHTGGGNSPEKPSDGRVVLKISLSPKEKALMARIYGPSRQMSANIRTALLDPRARRNPDQWREFAAAVTEIEQRLEVLLRNIQPSEAENIPEFISACLHALEILEALDSHDP